MSDKIIPNPRDHRKHGEPDWMGLNGIRTMPTTKAYRASPLWCSICGKGSVRCQESGCKGSIKPTKENEEE